VYRILSLHHRIIVLILLILIALSCWVYTVVGVGMAMSAWDMTLINLNIQDFSDSMKMTNSHYYASKFNEIIFIFLMWFFMMIAMMLPSAVPFIMIFDKISDQRKKQKYSYAPTFIFFLSYILVWGLFSFCTAIIHFFLQKNNILNHTTLSVSHLVGGLLFILSGIYQLTPFKETCLRYCRNPIEFLSSKKIFHHSGAFYIGLKHGFFCVCCCWTLMLLLFYSGIMNLFWIVGLSLYVIIEKFVFFGKKINLFSGLILIFFGLRIILINL
jgi:predicted metal-binding membrane protein